MIDVCLAAAYCLIGWGVYYVAFNLGFKRIYCLFFQFVGIFLIAFCVLYFREMIGYPLRLD